MWFIPETQEFVVPKSIPMTWPWALSEAKRLGIFRADRVYLMISKKIVKGLQGEQIDEQQKAFFEICFFR